MLLDHYSCQSCGSFGIEISTRQKKIVVILILIVMRNQCVCHDGTFASSSPLLSLNHLQTSGNEIWILRLNTVIALSVCSSCSGCMYNTACCFMMEGWEKCVCVCVWEFPWGKRAKLYTPCHLSVLLNSVSFTQGGENKGEKWRLAEKVSTGEGPGKKGEMKKEVERTEREQKSVG